MSPRRSSAERHSAPDPSLTCAPCGSCSWMHSHPSSSRIWTTSQQRFAAGWGWMTPAGQTDAGVASGDLSTFGRETVPDLERDPSRLLRVAVCEELYESVV